MAVVPFFGAPDSEGWQALRWAHLWRQFRAADPLEPQCRLKGAALLGFDDQEHFLQRTHALPGRGRRGEAEGRPTDQPSIQGASMPPLELDTLIVGGDARQLQGIRVGVDKRTVLELFDDGRADGATPVQQNAVVEGPEVKVVRQAFGNLEFRCSDAHRESPLIALVGDRPRSGSCCLTAAMR